MIPRCRCHEMVHLMESTREDSPLSSTFSEEPFGRETSPTFPFGRGCKLINMRRRTAPCGWKDSFSPLWELSPRLWLTTQQSFEGMGGVTNALVSPSHQRNMLTF